MLVIQESQDEIADGPPSLSDIDDSLESISEPEEEEEEDDIKTRTLLRARGVGRRGRARGERRRARGERRRGGCGKDRRGGL